MKVLAGAGHPGGANAIIPVIKKLKDNKEEIFLIKSTLVVEDFYQKNGLSSQQDFVDADVILTATASEKNTIDQELIKYGKEKVIPTIAVLDFWNLYKERFSDESGNLIYLPDRIAVMDELAKRAMLKESFPENILAVTGQPAFDNLEELARKFTEEDKIRVRNKLGVRGCLVPYICHTDKGLSRDEYGFNDQDIVSIIIEALQGEYATFVIRPHPREHKEKPEKFEAFRKQAEMKGILAIVQGEATTDEVCLASDLVTGVFSTTLINCAYMNIDAVSLSMNNKKGDDILITRILGVTPYANSFDEGVDLVRNALFDKDCRMQMKEMRKEFKTDGKAAERVVNLVYDVVRSKNESTN